MLIRMFWFWFWFWLSFFPRRFYCMADHLVEEPAPALPPVNYEQNYAAEIKGKNANQK